MSLSADYYFLVLLKLLQCSSNVVSLVSPVLIIHFLPPLLLIIKVLAWKLVVRPITITMLISCYNRMWQCLALRVIKVLAWKLARPMPITTRMSISYNISVRVRSIVIPSLHYFDATSPLPLVIIEEMDWCLVWRE